MDVVKLDDKEKIFPAYKKAFSSGNSVNNNSKKFLLDRINLNDEDNTYNKFLFKIFQSRMRKK